MALFCGVCAVIRILSAQLRLHCRAARIIFYLPKDNGISSSIKVCKLDYNQVILYYKVEILKLFYKANST